MIYLTLAVSIPEAITFRPWTLVVFEKFQYDSVRFRATQPGIQNARLNIILLDRNFFYKNVMGVGVLFWFQFYCGWSTT